MRLVQRNAGEDLRLAAGEQRRAVRARGNVDLALDRPDLVLRAAVRPLLVDRDPAPDDLLLQGVEGARDLGAPLGINLSVVPGARILLEDLLLDRLGGVLTRELLGDLSRLVKLRAVRGLDLLQELRVDLRRLDLDLLLARLGAELLERCADLLDLLVRDVERVQDLSLADAFGSALDHEDRLAGAGDDQVHLELLVGLLGGIDDEVAIKLSDAHRPDVGVHGNREIATAAAAAFIARMS